MGITWTGRTVVFAGLVVCLALLGMGLGWRALVHEAVPVHLYQAETNSLDGWTAYGGTWSSADRVISSHHGEERAAKLMTGSEQWTNYTMSAEMRFSGEHGDMGLIIRSRDENVGLDAYNGYYVGLRMDGGGSLLIGRSNYGWWEARPVPVPGGLHSGSWLRLTVTAYGCYIGASVEDLATSQMAWIAFRERSCLTSGRIGLRSVDIEGVWRNVSIKPATQADYLALEQHARSVEQPVIPNGPFWWTPWHVGMLFVGVLTAALLAQFAYFRVERWKSDTIMQERERLAHEIHDTMAQSFAGVGYQIQGIRSSVVRGEHLDARHIADQLSVAYQLIRRCHEEASGTIAMLGLASPLVQRRLLQTLKETAGRIAGDKIATRTHLHGSYAPVSLSLADALLHIGQEAIANAVSHADPTVLTITLRYEEESVEMIVADNGHGFEMSPQTAGFGIMGMQKRARTVAAVLEIVSAPGRGTEVRVRARRQQDGLVRRGMMRLRGLLGRESTRRDG